MPTAKLAHVMTNKPSYGELERRVVSLQNRVAELEQAVHATPDTDRRLERLRNHVESVIRGMFGELMVIDRDFAITEVNESFLKTYDRSREAVIGHKCYEITHHQDRPCNVDDHPCPVHEVFASKKPCSAEHVHRATNGKAVFVQIHAVPVFGDDGEVESVIEIHHDITDRKRVEAEKLAREKLKAVLELAGAVCHELNQPMQVALVNAMRLKRQLTEDEPTRLAESVCESVERMAQLTKKLTHITRYETKDYVMGAKIIDIDKASNTE